MLYTDHEPGIFNVEDSAATHAARHGHNQVTGYITTATLIEVGEIMLDKRGGYLSNDVMPPWVFLDNMPNWEFGVITQIRDLARTLRNDISRSQTQSTEDPDLTTADPQFHFDNSSWLIPRTENEYREGLEALEKYLARLTAPDQPDAQFYARADNLRDWLSLVEKRLGSLSQRLSASVGQQRLNTDLGGDAEARQSTQSPDEMIIKTRWVEIDDVYFEARGTTWALIHFLRAIQVDFEQVLQKKNAVVSFRQIIRELEASQEPLHAPMVLNGNAFGMFANHSLVMANYIARANAAIIDLRNLLEQG
jgi:hypothetical protein